MILKLSTFFFFILVLTSTTLFGQDTFFAVATGAWTNTNTWANMPGGVPGSGGSGAGDFPATGDNVLTQGFQISIGLFFVNETVTCNNIAISHNTVNSIQYGGLFSTAEMVVEGGIACYDISIFAPTAPTVAVIQNTPSLTVTLTGSGALPVVDFWSVSAPFYNLVLNPGSGQTAFFNSPIAIGGGTFDIQSGTFDSNFSIQDASSPATSIIDVNSGAIMNVNLAINGDGTTTSRFNRMDINGTVTASASSYINTNTFNLNSTGVFNVLFNGVDQTEGWWHTTISPGTLSLDASSTIIFNANADQAMPAISYGNLSLSSTGAANKTLEGTGNFIVNGTFTVSSSSITFNSNAGSSNNLDFRGDIINFGSWGTLVNTNLRLNGSSAQDISGGNPINIQGLNVVVDNAAGVTVSNGLTMDRNLVLTNGTFTQTSGATTFNGSSLQTISGNGSASFVNLNIDNDLDNEGNVSVAGIITLGSGVVFDADGAPNNGSLTLVSDASGTARVALIPINSNFGGNVTVQRYMGTEAAGKPIFRYIASAVSGSTVNDWNDDNPIANTNTFLYDETIAGASFLGWTSASGGTSLTPGQGFASMADASSPITLDVTGPLNQGNISMSLDFTNGAGDDDIGWNLLGNPYASSIDWDNLQRSGNVDPAVAVSSNGATGQVQYLFWDGSVGSLTGGIIASGQAFWVRTNGNGQSVTFRESSKVTSDGAFYRTTNVVPDVLTIKLKQGNVEDATFIRLRDDATGDFDEFVDVTKRSNAIFNITSYSDDEYRMAINAYDQLENGKRIKLDLYRINPGSYTFTMEESFDESLRFILIDNFLDEEIPIEPSATDLFTYNFEVTADVLSFGAERFEIQVGASVITGIDEDIKDIILYPNPVNNGEALNLNISRLFNNATSVDIAIIDRKGALLSEQTLTPGVNGSVQIDMDRYSSGVYILRVIGNSATHHYKVIKN